MAVITINTKTANSLGANLEYDRRFRHWAKVVTSPNQIDLSQTGGYAITAPFIAWGKTVAVEPGQFLVMATEAGSNRYRDYEYAVIGIDKDGNPFLVDEDAINGAIAVAPDTVKARALNHRMYAIAVFLKFALGALQDRAPVIERAREALRSLTPDERALLVEEFGFVPAKPAANTSPCA